MLCGSKNQIFMRTKSLLDCNLVNRNHSSLCFFLEDSDGECERWTIPKLAEKNFFTSPSTENNQLLAIECLVSTRWIESTHSYKSAWVVRRHIFMTISFTQNWKSWTSHSPGLKHWIFSSSGIWKTEFIPRILMGWRNWRTILSEKSARYPVKRAGQW